MSVPPHNEDAEASLLGAMLLSRDAVNAATAAEVGDEDFYRPDHAHVYNAVKVLHDRGESVDAVTVSEELTRRGLLDSVGGRQALLRLQAATPASANAWSYARIVRDCALRRRLIAVAGEIAELGYDDSRPVAETFDEAESKLLEVGTARTSATSVLLGDALQRTLDVIEARTGALPGVATGYRDLDAATHGLAAGQLVILAARPGMGKSVIGVGTALNVARSGAPALVVSIEMDTVELAQRMLAGEANVPLGRIIGWTRDNPTLSDGEWTALQGAVSRLAALPLEIVEGARITVNEVRARARRARAKYGTLGLVVVDYLQLMEPTRRGSRTAENRQVEVSEISRGLKVLARELGCPVLALAQLNRQVEYRQDKRPMLADLRDSGSLEQDSDVVVFCYRDEVYNPGSRVPAELIIAKQRNGPTRTGPNAVKLIFRREYVRFDDLAVEEPGPEQLAMAGGPIDEPRGY